MDAEITKAEMEEEIKALRNKLEIAVKALTDIRHYDWMIGGKSGHHQYGEEKVHIASFALMKIETYHLEHEIIPKSS